MIKKVLKYILGGGLAAIIDLFFLWMFTEISNINYLLSAVFSFFISLVFSFYFQKYITFENKSLEYTKQALKFLIFQVLGMSANILLLYLLVDKIGFYYIYVAIFNKGLIFIWNFSMNYLFNF